MYSDERIKKDVVEQLVWDSRVDVSDLRVDVKAGRVMICGSVPSSFAKRAVHQDAWAIPGVRAVEDFLAIKGAAVDSDKEIGENISRLLKDDSVLSRDKIFTEVRHGAVDIYGRVDFLWKKNRIEMLVSDIKGVKRIINKLLVKPGLSLSDEAIGEDIKRALSRNHKIDDNEIVVEVENGKVILTGIVSDRAVYEAVRDIVSNTRGARSLDNRLEVATIFYSPTSRNMENYRNS